LSCRRTLYLNLPSLLSNQRGPLQCQLLGLPRSSYYHRPLPESDENRRLMRVIDEMYLAQPFYVSRQMTRD